MTDEMNDRKYNKPDGEEETPKDHAAPYASMTYDGYPLPEDDDEEPTEEELAALSEGPFASPWESPAPAPYEAAAKEPEPPRRRRRTAEPPPARTAENGNDPASGSGDRVAPAPMTPPEPADREAPVDEAHKEILDRPVYMPKDRANEAKTPARGRNREQDDGLDGLTRRNDLNALRKASGTARPLTDAGDYARMRAGGGMAAKTEENDAAPLETTRRNEPVRIHASQAPDNPYARPATAEAPRTRAPGANGPRIPAKEETQRVPSATRVRSAVATRQASESATRSARDRYEDYRVGSERGYTVGIERTGRQARYRDTDTARDRAAAARQENAGRGAYGRNRDDGMDGYDDGLDAEAYTPEEFGERGDPRFYDTRVAPPEPRTTGARSASGREDGNAPRYAPRDDRGYGRGYGYGDQFADYGDDMPRPNRRTVAAEERQPREDFVMPGRNERENPGYPYGGMNNGGRGNRSPLPQQDNGNPKDAPRKGGVGHVLLTLLVILLLLLGAALTAILVMNPQEGILADAKTWITDNVQPLLEAAKKERVWVKNITVAGNTNVTAPVETILTVTTDKDVIDVRALDGDGNDVWARTNVLYNANEDIWTLVVGMDTACEGTLQVQVMAPDSEDWQDVGDPVEMHITAPLGSIDPDGIGAEMTPDPFFPDGEPDDGTGSVDDDTLFWADDPDGMNGEDLTLTEEPTEEPTEAPTEAPTQAPTEAPTPAPTPTATPTPEPTPTPTPEPTPEPTPTPVPTPTPALQASADPVADPKLLEVKVWDGKNKMDFYTRAVEDTVAMPIVDEYTKANNGVLTFRTDAFRQNAAVGTLSAAPSEMEIAWTAEAGKANGSNVTYYGIGWTGQPVIVKWSKEVREMSNLTEEKKAVSGLKEVIVAGIDGNIYFLDLADGAATRKAIKLGYPMRGTPSVHPSGCPYMTVGQYARKMKSGTGKIGQRNYNLYNQKEMTLVDGLDGGNSKRTLVSVGSFETSALIDRTSDTLINAGTNGLLYVTKLNSKFDYGKGTYSTSPATIVMSAKGTDEKAENTSVEASVAMYDHYVYYGDMGGIVRCVDVNEMKVVWAAETGDSIESTPALDLGDDRSLSLYTANEVNLRKKGSAEVRCFDALTGKVKWTREFPVAKDTKKKTVSGFRASPVVGRKNLIDYVYFTVSGLSSEGCASLGIDACKAAIVAMNKVDGKVVWARELSAITYSSPIALYDGNGDGWIVQAANDGTVLLLDGQDGGNVATLKLDGNIEASPAAYNDTVIIGTTWSKGSKIVAIKVK